MSVGVLGISAAALALSVVAVTGPSRMQAGAGGAGAPSGVIFHQAEPEQTSATLEDVRIPLSLDDAPASELFAMIGERAGLPVFVHWGNIPLAEDDTITLNVGEVALPTAIRLVNMRIGTGEISYRVRDGVLEFAYGSYFDQLERQLVRYDLSDAIVHAEAGEIADLIHALVEPYAWEANGGETATLHIVGNQMFVEAPQRLLPRIEWILAQLAGDEEAADDDPDAGAGAQAEPAEPAAVRVQVITLQHVGAEDLANAASDIVGSLESVRIRADPRTNALLVAAPQDWQDRIQRLVALLDRPAGERGVALSPPATPAAP